MSTVLGTVNMNNPIDAMLADQEIRDHDDTNNVFECRSQLCDYKLIGYETKYVIQIFVQLVLEC